MTDPQRSGDTQRGDTQRLVPETEKGSGSARTEFARDRARVLHCAAFRRLAAKTQVHSDSSDGLVRTRLTHSLEVAQIAREIGQALGCDPDVVDTAGLAHDLGHPPFGHNGEDALHEAALPCGGFEGNAQTLRVLTRLEAKIVDGDGVSVGLNLTRASLDATAKYPWPRDPAKRKFGVYADDWPVFAFLRADTPTSVGEPPRRCLEAQVMDWADDVAYSVHDVEDGISAGIIDLALLLRDRQERAQLCVDVAEVYSPLSAEELAGPLDELLAEPALQAAAGFDGGSAALVALKRVASLFIGRFAQAAVDATRSAYGPGPLHRYAADLIVPDRVRAHCALLKGIALRYVMRQPRSARRYAEEQEVLRELVEALVARAPEALDPLFAPLWRAAADDAARLRVVIDQIASLTDPAARAWHRRLVRPAA